jgi:hypothetical protein
MRRRCQEPVALLQRRANLAEGEAAGLPETAVDQLGRGGGGAAAEIALLA